MPPPVPSVPQIEPFHRAMQLVTKPPAFVNDPPTISSLLNTVNADTRPEGLPPDVPTPTFCHVAPLKRAM
jgi:hypothetical protein